MKTLLEYITFVKGVEYLIIVAFCFGFIALWLLVHTREKEAMKRTISVIIPLSLVFAGAAVVLATYGNPEVTAAPAVRDASFPEYYSNGSPAGSSAAQSQDRWLQVNDSEYLSVAGGPATKFHQLMSDRVSCSTCHHNSGDEVHACRDCHDSPFDPLNSSKPGLKAAYHQRCMSCHSEDFKGGPESCGECHTGGEAVSAPPRPHQLTWETCNRCHQDGIPGGQVSKIVYHDSCLKCHTKGIAGAAMVPADHAGRASSTCQGCHKPSGG